MSLPHGQRVVTCSRGAGFAAGAAAAAAARRRFPCLRQLPRLHTQQLRPHAKVGNAVTHVPH